MGRSVGGIDLNSCFSQLFIRQNRPVLPHHRRPQRRRRRRRRGRRVLESAKPQLTSIPHSRANSWLELMTGSRSRTSPRHQTSMPLAFRTVVTKRALPSLPFSSIFFFLLLSPFTFGKLASFVCDIIFHLSFFIPRILSLVAVLFGEKVRGSYLTLEFYLFPR